MNLKRSGKSKGQSAADAKDWVLRRKGGEQVKKSGTVREIIGLMLLSFIWFLFVISNIVQKILGRRKESVMMSLEQVTRKIMSRVR